MLLSEPKAMPPLIAQRDRQLHVTVQVLQHLVYQVLALALLLLALVLQVLPQLRERLVVSALVVSALVVSALAQLVPVLKQLVQQVPLVLEQLVPQNFLQY
jgi:hypothetical protein